LMNNVKNQIPLQKCEGIFFVKEEDKN
jgi:hypothetical protein